MLLFNYVKSYNYVLPIHLLFQVNPVFLQISQRRALFRLLEQRMSKVIGIEYLRAFILQQLGETDRQLVLCPVDIQSTLI